MLRRAFTPKLTKVSSQVHSDDWGRIYDSDPGAFPSQSRCWRDIVLRAGGFRDVSRRYEFSDGVEAILPLFAPRWLPGPVAVFRSPPPAWGFGGLVATGILDADHVEQVLRDCAAVRCAAIQIRPNPLTASLWSAAADAAGWTAVARNAHVLDLSGGWDAVWNRRFPSNTRRKVRNAEKNGVTVEVREDDAGVAIFHGLLRASFERWGRSQNEFAWLARARGLARDPESKFRTMVRDGGGLVRVWIASVGGEPVSAALVLRGHVAHYTRGAMDEEKVGQTYANYLLHARAIEDACAAGCGHYHMGETGNSESLAAFKSRFGAVAVPYAEYRHERIPLLSAAAAARGVVKKAIGFKDV